MDIKAEDIIRAVTEYSTKPPLYEPGEEKFWDDEYISISMLDAHLNQEFDAASRRFEYIDGEIEHLIKTGILQEGDRVLDLGCGPGLYASRLCRKGLEVTGIDISRRSIDYAKGYAGENNLSIEYINGNFFDIDYSSDFNAVMQIYGELNTFSDIKRDELLGKIHRALKPDGLLIFDVSTRTQRMKEGASNHWYMFNGGLWRPGSHLLLEEGYDYPEENAWLDQYIVIDEKGISVYRDWFHDYSLHDIRSVLENAGFTILQVWNDLTGTPYEDDGDWIAVVARKV